MSDIPQSKVCTKCGEEKPLDDFYREKRGLYGRRADCKGCKDKASRAWFRSHPEAQERGRQNVRKWYRENRERAIAYAHEYAQKNREKVLAKARNQWHNKTDKEEYKRKRNKRRKELYQTDPEFRERRLADGRQSARLRRYRVRGATGHHTRKEWLALCEHYGHKCLCCGSQDKLVRDHVVPISKGGTNDISNIQPLCSNCNGRKNDKTIDYRPSGERPALPRWIQKRLF